MATGDADSSLCGGERGGEEALGCAEGTGGTLGGMDWVGASAISAFSGHNRGGWVPRPPLPDELLCLRVSFGGDAEVSVVLPRWSWRRLPQAADRLWRRPNVGGDSHIRMPSMVSR